jgi:hypothetical protein
LFFSGTLLQRRRRTSLTGRTERTRRCSPTIHHSSLGGFKRKRWQLAIPRLHPLRRRRKASWSLLFGWTLVKGSSEELLRCWKLQQKERYRDSPMRWTGLVGSGSRGCHVFGGGKRNVSHTKSSIWVHSGESTIWSAYNRSIGRSFCRTHYEPLCSWSDDVVGVCHHLFWLDDWLRFQDSGTTIT